MKVRLELDNKMRIRGVDSNNNHTYFDTVADFGGDNSAPTPMAIMLEAMASCSFLDVVSILRKKRKTVANLEIFADGVRADQHPKVFTKVHLKYLLHSPDAEISDLIRAIELSQSTYCGASAMFKQSGCEVTWEADIVKS